VDAYAALKRRSSTVVLAVVALLQNQGEGESRSKVKSRVKGKNKVKGSGQECPLHTSREAGSSPGLGPGSE